MVRRAMPVYGRNEFEQHSPRHLSCHANRHHERRRPRRLLPTSQIHQPIAQIYGHGPKSSIMVDMATMAQAFSLGLLVFSRFNREQIAVFWHLCVTKATNKLICEYCEVQTKREKNLLYIYLSRISFYSMFFSFSRQWPWWYSSCHIAESSRNIYKIRRFKLR